MTTLLVAATAAAGVALLLMDRRRRRQTPIWSLEVVRATPHNPSSFTQGLAFSDQGFLFESTGDPFRRGDSMLAQVRIDDGVLLKKRPLLNAFGEGIAVLGNELFQLTWTEGTCYVWDVTTLRLKRLMRYQGEGWGLCSDGRSLIMSDGSNVLQFRDPRTFDVLKTVPTPVTKLNDLEYVEGYVLANVWHSTSVAVLDPENGTLVAWIDASPLLEMVPRNVDVLNGIAWDKSSRKLYMTGKFWPKMFEVQLSPTTFSKRL